MVVNGGKRKSPSVASPDEVERFFAKVKIGDCWEYLGWRDKLGYGRHGYGGRGVVWLAHRWAYEYLVGPIPDELPHLDHRCRNTSCVNPDHLEPVTARENTVARGVGANSSPVCNVCGGEFTSVTYKNGRTRRVCRACASRRAREAELRKAPVAS